ncbi:hypothetical protein [Aeromonas veronii]|uniref:hypothetical protein n=1 Tax=Aeromonas veronii TaxID=654 RepID=UPI001F4394B7|nr:hypothetical protein [Aeromonas veronii]MCF5899982.1 hypothetical protein [Aeromonas veronii]
MGNPQKINETYLTIIQTNIGRLATTSFLIKGWSVTLVAAIFALAAKDSNSAFVLIAYFPAIMFWLLDSYFLGMERRFVSMYNAASSGKLNNFEVQPHNFTTTRASMAGACYSRTILLFHGSILATILLVMFGISRL